MKSTIRVFIGLIFLSANANAVSQIVINDLSQCTSDGGSLTCRGENLNVTEEPNDQGDENVQAPSNTAFETAQSCHRECISPGIRLHECFKWKDICG